MRYFFGIVISASWMFLNSFFLMRLVKLAALPKPNQKNRIFILTVLKFPVLYLIGFFILKSRYFPTMSFLVGLSVALVGIVGLWMKMNVWTVKSV